MELFIRLAWPPASITAVKLDMLRCLALRTARSKQERQARQIDAADSPLRPVAAEPVSSAATGAAVIRTGRAVATLAAAVGLRQKSDRPPLRAG